MTVRTEPTIGRVATANAGASAPYDPGNPRPPSLFDTVLMRLRYGPATALSLARWCNLHTPFMERMLEAWKRERRIRKIANRYALPFNPLSPAGRITVGRGYRWAA